MHFSNQVSVHICFGSLRFLNERNNCYEMGRKLIVSKAFPELLKGDIMKETQRGLLVHLEGKEPFELGRIISIRSLVCLQASIFSESRRTSHPACRQHL